MEVEVEERRDTRPPPTPQDPRGGAQSSTRVEDFRTPTSQLTNRREVARKAILKKAKRRVKKPDAITLNAADEKTVREAMVRARQKIELANLGIEETRPRGGFNGGFVIELPRAKGKEGEAQASRLLAAMEEILEGMEVTI